MAALRSSATKFLKSMAGRLGGASHFTTSSTAPEMNLAKHNNNLKARMMKTGEIVPVGMAVGMIALSTTFGIYTAAKELMTGPNVYVKKSRRETLPEVVEPERVLQQSETFVKKSLFRRIALLGDKFRQDQPPPPDIQPAPVDIFSRPLKAETLKDIGVDPSSSH